MKKFAGFTPQQQYTLLSKQGYTGPADQASMDKFIASTPGAASKMGDYAKMAQRRLMGTTAIGLAEGGMITQGSTGEANWFEFNGQRYNTLQEAQAAQRATPTTTPTQPTPSTPTTTNTPTASGGDSWYGRNPTQARPETITPTNTTNTPAPAPTPSGTPLTLQEQLAQGPGSGTPTTQNTTPPTTTTNTPTSGGPDTGTPRQGSPLTGTVSNPSTNVDARRSLVSESINTPTDLVTQAEVAQAQNSPLANIAAGTGQVGPAATSEAAQASGVTARGPEVSEAATMQATTVGDQTPQATAAQGEVSEDAQAEAQRLSPDNLSQLDVQAAQIDDPTQVIPPEPRKIEAGELVSGSAVDMSKVNEAMDIKAAQANPSKMATVQGQLEGLMQQFEGGETPAWAAGAMRQATATLAARGLGASSMAGQAVVQAAMESALPVAMADAQTRASFEAQNLSNRQQTALFAAEQRAKFLGMEFDQNFQSRVINAAKVSDIANQNFTSEVQIALENSRLTQTAELANLDVTKAKMLSDMAAMTQVDLTNLNNRQQAAVQNAQAFLQMDMANLDNDQQTAIFNTQNRTNTLLSDQAAENAAAQFNAASENQTNQFFADLQSTVSRFNAQQINAIRQFNAGEENTVSQFNSQQQNLRDQFNASNSLIIAQANAQWRQNLELTNTAAQNEANLEAARAATGFTQTALDAVWQRERDIMAFAYQSAENAADRDFQLLMGDRAVAAERQSAIGGAIGTIVGSVGARLFESIF